GVEAAHRGLRHHARRARLHALRRRRRDPQLPPRRSRMGRDARHSRDHAGRRRVARAGPRRRRALGRAPARRSAGRARPRRLPPRDLSSPVTGTLRDLRRLGEALAVIIATWFALGQLLFDRVIAQADGSVFVVPYTQSALAAGFDWTHHLYRFGVL